MLEEIEEFKKYVEIAGFQNVKIGELDTFLVSVQSKKQRKTETQFFNADYVASWEHLYFAAVNSLLAFQNHTNISKSLAMETMLFASSCRQIRKATEFFGINENSSRIGVLIIGSSVEKVEATLSEIEYRIGGIRDDNVLELSKEKTEGIIEAFDISDAQIKAVSRGRNDAKRTIVNLIIEKMALLAVDH